MKGRTRGAQTRGGECCLSLVVVANSGEAGEGRRKGKTSGGHTRGGQSASR